MHFTYNKLQLYLKQHTPPPIQMNKECKQILNHLSRIEGQIKSLKSQINTNQDCDKILHLYSSILNSAKSLNAKLLLNMLKQKKLKLKPEQEQQIIKSLKI